MSQFKPFNTTERPLSARRWSAFNRGHPAFDLIRRDNIASGKWPKDKFKPLSEQYEDLGLDKLSDFELEQFYPGIPFSMIPATHHISRILEEEEAAKQGVERTGIDSPESDFAYKTPELPAWVDGVGLVSSKVRGALAQTDTPEQGLWGKLLSQVAEANVENNAGEAKHAGSSSLGNASAGLPDIRHIPGSRTYVYNDPAKGSRSVTPFVDEIPGFDWHRDRSLFNFVPRKKPKPVYSDESLPSPIGLDNHKRISHYEDHRGNKWTPDFLVATGPYHGYTNFSFRGTGQYIGCQAVFDVSGSVMTSGSKRSTFDYGAPGTGEHWDVDVTPHRSNGGKSYRDPDLTTVF